MQQNRQYIKDGQIVDDPWAIVPSTEHPETVSVPTSHALVPVAVWQAQPALQKISTIGVWLDNSVNLDELAPSIVQLPVIAIEFPVFVDGRGFSLARLLRERYQYPGELRAIGHVIRDQLCYLKRCGFNAFSFAQGINLAEAITSLNDFTESYQTSVDQPDPLFRRRA